ncbi:MAG: M20/M25/M40 family metallo-hydrolase [Ignavibacteriales bacterium]|nr:M20/M25/M40 family metallo-hydrolase [Ignavibacteriales bacterium]
MNKIFVSIACIIFIAIIAESVNVFSQNSGDSNAFANHQKLARDIFRELIEINTTLNVGSTKAAEAMAARLRTAGFSESDIQLVGPRPENMNLVVRYHGKSTRRPILLIGHLDVVEALRQDWSFDPFTFLEKDGYFYGRGTSDMKCEDADIVANLIRLKSEGFIPNRDIIVALTEQEEGGNANGIAWLLANRRDLINAEFAINLEGGGGEIKAGKSMQMEVQTSEKIYISFQLEVKNRGGHSSIPVKDNAIYRLSAGLNRLAQYDFPIRLNETTRSFFERAAIKETGQVKADMIALLKTPLDTAAANRLASSSSYYNAMMRTTCIPTMLSGGHAENALPQTASAIVNCRMLPDDSAENVLATLNRILADNQIIVTQRGQPQAAPLSPLRKDVMDIVEKLTTSMWPGVIVTPIMSTGASDGRYLRQAGIPVYGVSGIFADIDDVRAHGRDERIGVKEFYEGVEFMYKFIKILTSGS